MARGDHPQRTPFYGVVLIVTAMAVAMIVYRTAPVWLQVPVYVAAFLTALVGFVMTFRDLS
ncbi:hypothetical protein BFN03_00445 [Rhodococcus sp. WMMA185]|uniref:hypothetical protein n=1 Tax=Rhodococcus sp. WMMA185 TaxID=679318 RepID=UPI0008790865|nr:hypothetical protein [Rhodococcus sp. WMMA185]AOW91663.1 hypothetical protein BFN03_00445 [Rhodococcus sp. WMMA185]